MASATVPISNNTLSGTSNGITFNLFDSANMNTTIANNTLTNHEANSIGVNFFANSLTCSIHDNTLSLGNWSGDAVGVLANLGGTTQTLDISNNTIQTASGGMGSQFGVLCKQSSTSGVAKSVTLANNTLTQCGNAPPVILSPYTAGMAVVLTSSDNIFVDCESNTTINCGASPSGLGGILVGRINEGAGVPGHVCWKLYNCMSDTGFTLVNDPPFATDFMLDALGNTGTLIPYMGSPYETGPCP